MKRLAAVLALVILAACGGDDDVADDTHSTTEEPTTTLGADEDIAEAIDDLGSCVLEDGATITEEQLTNELCTFPDTPDHVLAIISIDCPDGSTLYSAGDSPDDPKGGWVILDDGGEGQWHTGPYTEMYDTSCGTQ